MAETIRRLWDLPFMPHGMCYLWQPWLVWLHVICDLSISAAYLVIPVALIHFIRRRRDVPFNSLFWCFGLFIVACGATHFMEAWNVWHANYILAGGIKAITVFASVPTALLLVRIIPQALAIPSPAQLRRSEERFRMAAKAGKMFAYEWDVVTDTIVRSSECAAVLGDERAVITGQQMLSKVHQDDREDVVAAVAGLTPEQPNLQICHRMMRLDGTVIWIERDSRAYFDDQGKMLRVIGMVSEVTEKKRLEQELRNLSYRLLRSQDTLRRNMARELHESLGQTLAALKLTIANFEYCRDNPEGSHDDITRARDLADDAVREVRVMSYLMHPPLLDEAGLRSALLSYARGFASRSGVDVQVDVADNLGRHPQEIEITIFRIVQEALTNVYRHAESQTARIGLKIEDCHIHLDIQDRGRGLPAPFDTIEPNAVLGVGIVGMRERVKQLGGVFHIESSPGCGTLLRISLPCAKSPVSTTLKMPSPGNFNFGEILLNEDGALRAADGKSEALPTLSNSNAHRQEG